MPLVEKLNAVQKRTETGSRLLFEMDVAPGAIVAMEIADLAEVLGNVLKNAARHSRTRVRITALGDGRVVIDDDRPGIPDDLRDAVTVRGNRLDQCSGGAGLGLEIVQEILEAYGRALSLESSPLGGLRVVI